MDLQFQKESVAYLHKVLDQAQTQEYTQEVRLPDGMPDIGRVIASWAQVLVRGKEWRNGSVGISGGTMVWLIYAPEDGSGYQCLETWIPFQLKWDIPDGTQDGRISATTMLQSVDARSIAARKIIVRAAVDISVKAWIRDRAEISVTDDLPEDICVLKHTYPMLLASATGEKQFALEEPLELPANMPTPDKLVYYTLFPKVSEQKIMADKVVFRGDCAVHLLYMGADGQLCRWDGNVPFSQYTELDQDCSDHAEIFVEFAVTNLDVEKTAEGNLLLKAGILSQFVVMDRKIVSVVEDVYSPRRQVAIQSEMLALPSLLDTVPLYTKAQLPMDGMGDVVVDVQFCAGNPRMYRDQDGVRCELSGNFSVLERDAEGNLQHSLYSWSETQTVQADLNTGVESQPEPSLPASVQGDKLEAEIPMMLRYWSGSTLPMVTGLEMGEMQDMDPNRPTLVLRRRGDRSLWELAKEYGSTVESIQKANKLEAEPESKKMLLIPIL